MTVAHLQGKRTGRRRGSRSTSPAIRDLRWASRNYAKNVEPPTAGAKFWADMARNEPEKFLAAVATLTSLDAAKPQSRDQPQTGSTVARAGQKLMAVGLDGRFVVETFRRRNPTFIPDDAEVVGCAFAKDCSEAVFIVSSATFRPLAEGEPIPDLRRKFGK